MSTEYIRVFGRGWGVDSVLYKLGANDMPLEVQDMLLDLVRDTFEIVINVFDPSVKWDVFRGFVAMNAVKNEHDVFTGYVYVLPDDLFLSDARDKVIDAVYAPLFGEKMEDGLSSPLANDVEQIMLYLPPDEYAYLED